LAKKHGLSFERLRKIFRARIGVAPGAYRMRLRMDRAQALLRDGSLTVAEVAAAVGCASTATFSLQFKSHTGMPPDAWRRGQNR
jgi:transcriptional regulator GlxA family with amidase domain